MRACSRETIFDATRMLGEPHGGFRPTMISRSVVSQNRLPPSVDSNSSPESSTRSKVSGRLGRGRPLAEVARVPGCKHLGFALGRQPGARLLAPLLREAVPVRERVLGDLADWPRGEPGGPRLAAVDR